MCPLEPTSGVLDDFAEFFLHKPKIDTLVSTHAKESRTEYEQRILQRLPIDVHSYSVLNIHRIGIEAPTILVFEQALKWSGASPCWPNHVATVENVIGSDRDIRILLLGGWTRNMLRRTTSSNYDLGVLFRLTELRRQEVPGPSDVDNARYLLYRCSGGYPIGVFCIYVRSPIESLDETESAQVFFAVSFNFFGLAPNWATRGLGRIWESIHNRVTANVLNRFKSICEAELAEIEH